MVELFFASFVSLFGDSVAASFGIFRLDELDASGLESWRVEC